MAEWEQNCKKHFWVETYKYKYKFPRKKWRDDVEEDLKEIDIRNWRAMAKERAKWRIVEKEKTVKGLLLLTEEEEEG